MLNGEGKDYKLLTLEEIDRLDEKEYAFKLGSYYGLSPKKDCVISDSVFAVHYEGGKPVRIYVKKNMLNEVLKK